MRIPSSKNHVSPVGQAKSLEELGAALKKEEAERVARRQEQEDRVVLRQERDEVEKMAQRFKELNGTKADRAKDDPNRVVLDDARMLSVPADLGLRAWRSVTFFQGGSGRLGHRVTGVATFDDTGKLQKLESERTYDGHLVGARSSYRDRVLADFSDGETFNISRNRSGGRWTASSTMSGELSGPVQYAYSHTVYHGGHFGEMREPTRVYREGTLNSKA